MFRQIRTRRHRNLRGYPMSDFVAELTPSAVSYEALELSCHAMEAYCQRLASQSELDQLKVRLPTLFCSVRFLNGARRFVPPPENTDTLGPLRSTGLVRLGNNPVPTCSHPCDFFNISFYPTRPTRETEKQSSTKVGQLPVTNAANHRPKLQFES